uniref:Uncharacterized protein n=1 Tax=Brassica oleracea TaxID=3712 RepID=A0A3P6E958_BRAOL|nr:unnamed protein product [Brassica oleracea]
MELASFSNQSSFSYISATRRPKKRLRLPWCLKTTVTENHSSEVLASWLLSPCMVLLSSL